MKRIREQVEEIKAEMCDTRCKWVEKVNQIRIKSPADMRKLDEMLNKACADCPLRKL